MKHWKLILTIIMLIITLVFVFIGFSENKKTKLNDDTKQSVSKGNKNSDVSIVVFGDFKCPYCKKYNDKVFKKLENDYIKDGKVYYKFVNLAFMGEDSINAAKLGQSIFKTDSNKYWEYHEHLYSIQRNESKKQKQWLTNDLLDKELNSLNFNSEQIKDIKDNFHNSSKVNGYVESDRNLKDEYKIQQVPTMMINGKVVKDIYDYQNVKRQIDKERQ
ncbi:DsbA family protein [Staphylococcus shinii]|uniref:DsbA family protein n=1 Tax=Staphylococcus shinii TaxID=2912228 RepID=UPI003EEB5E7E